MSSYLGFPWARMKSHWGNFDLTNGHCAEAFDPSTVELKLAAPCFAEL